MSRKPLHLTFQQEVQLILMATGVAGSLGAAAGMVQAITTYQHEFNQLESEIEEELVRNTRTSSADAVLQECFMRISRQHDVFPEDYAPGSDSVPAMQCIGAYNHNFISYEMMQRGRGVDAIITEEIRKNTFKGMKIGAALSVGFCLLGGWRRGGPEI